MDNLYKKAVMEKWTFKTIRGTVSIVDIFTIPLTNSDGFSLDDLARYYSKKVQETEEESFVTPKPSNKVFKEKLELLKDVIKTRIEQREAATEAKKKAERKQKILEILAKKQDESLEAKTEEELLKELEALD